MLALNPDLKNYSAARTGSTSQRKHIAKQVDIVFELPIILNFILPYSVCVQTKVLQSRVQRSVSIDKLAF